MLLDLRMPQMDGLTCLTKIRKEFPDMKVAMLSVSQDPELIQTALKRGANAYIVKSIDPDDLAGALRQALEGNVFTTAGITEDPGERAAKDAGLTERELGIVRAVARGLSNEAISKELWVAEQTVKFHLTNIYRKLGVTNRTEAARYAFEQGLVEPEARLCVSALEALDARAADDRVAAVVEPNPRLAAAVVVRRPDDQRCVFAGDADSLRSFRLRAAPDSDERVLLPLPPDRRLVGVPGQDACLAAAGSSGRPSPTGAPARSSRRRRSP